jgi:hypothetical protein
MKATHVPVSKLQLIQDIRVKPPKTFTSFRGTEDGTAAIGDLQQKYVDRYGFERTFGQICVVRPTSLLIERGPYLLSMVETLDLYAKYFRTRCRYMVTTWMQEAAHETAHLLHLIRQSAAKLSTHIRPSLALPVIAWAPKRYTLHDGIHLNTQTPVFTCAKRYGLPLIAVLFAVLIGTTTWTRTDGFTVSSPSHSRTNTTDTAKNTAHSGASGTSSSGQHGDITSDTPDNASHINGAGLVGATFGTNQVIKQPLRPAPIAPNPVGGRGSTGSTTNAVSLPTVGTGQSSANTAVVPTPLQSGTGSAGQTSLPLPIVVTVPGQNVDVDNKKIVGTSGTSITLN